MCVDDSRDRLCNIRSSAGARREVSTSAHRSWLSRALKAPIRRPVNHADAPNYLLSRFGTDLAQWKNRRPTRVNGAFLIGRKETFEMNAASLTLNALLKSAPAHRKPEARC